MVPNDWNSKKIQLSRISQLLFADPDVSKKKSIFLLSFGGVKVNWRSGNFGERSQLFINIVNCGSPATFFEVRMYLRGSGLAPSSIQICQSNSAPRNASCVHLTPPITLWPTT